VRLPLKGGEILYLGCTLFGGGVTCDRSCGESAAARGVVSPIRECACVVDACRTADADRGAGMVREFAKVAEEHGRGGGG